MCRPNRRSKPRRGHGLGRSQQPARSTSSMHGTPTRDRGMIERSRRRDGTSHGAASSSQAERGQRDEDCSPRIGPQTRAPSDQAGRPCHRDRVQPGHLRERPACDSAVTMPLSSWRGIGACRVFVQLPAGVERSQRASGAWVGNTVLGSKDVSASKRRPRPEG
jgi:hypothetical protein